MNNNYKYKGVHLKPKIAKAIILERFAGQTVSRREIDAQVIEYHQSHGGLPSTAETNPIKAALRYLKDKGFAENVSRGSGSTWRIAERRKTVSSTLDVHGFIAVISEEIQYLTQQIESLKHRKTELEAMLTEYNR